MKNYILNLFCAFSQFINALAGGNHNELLSARVYREERQWLVYIIDTLFFDPNHCRESYEFEAKNEQLPEYKNIKL